MLHSQSWHLIRGRQQGWQQLEVHCSAGVAAGLQTLLRLRAGQVRRPWQACCTWDAAFGVQNLWVRIMNRVGARESKVAAPGDQPSRYRSWGRESLSGQGVGV